MIKLEGIYKVYPPCLVVLKDVWLTITKGEFVALMGTSGSGKSTLLQIIGCLDLPSSGNYWFNEQAVISLKEKELAQIRNQKIGFVFQSFHLLPRMSALRNVELPLVYASLPRKIRREKAKELLDLVGLDKRIKHVPAKLSGGEQQRVAIARAIANDPTIILADEPTGNLDSQSGKEIMEIFCQLHRQGTTILVITHNLQVAAYAQRIITLKDGNIRD